MRHFHYLKLILALFFFSQCEKRSSDTLYQGFINPPAETRPFVRWWWNGNRITGKEIIRQLELLHDAGIGGVEINPIGIPEWCDTTGTRELVWLSPEWNRLLALASEEAGKRGMITDLIVGSGWPFGGEFLKESEIIQRVMTNTISCKEGDVVAENLESLYEKALSVQSRRPEGETKSLDLVFISLVPENAGDTSGIRDLSGFIDSGGQFRYIVPEGKYMLAYGIIEKGHRHVQNGAPGAAGPVMDHYKKEVTLAYLSRLKKISDDTGIPLSKLIRALFCDSIELAGANWTDGFEEIFLKTYGYELKPYFPFIFYESYRGYINENFSDDLSDRVKRVRYDYNKLLVKVFLDNFTRTFQEFCTENGLLCRYQAYGTPFLMGMMEGNMIPDIPESNNWLYSINMDTDEWIWNQDHGYMIWNLYAASGGHLAGRKIISCEAMTNTSGVFKTSLEDIKRHDDMNFITGINHTILHGYNYSPVEAGFPGWIRFGAYFSEQNTWWPYFRKWTDYNARLSYIFQNSSPVKNLAIMGPTGDVWSDRGLIRVPFHKEPWYCYRLWESICQAGSSCDYIDENIIVKGTKNKGKLQYGPMSYNALILCNVKSIEPETALSVKKFVEEGGKLVVIDGYPYRSLSLINSEGNDKIVKDVFKELSERYTTSVIEIPGPADPEKLLPWTIEMLNSALIEPDVEIKDPDKNLFQITHNDGKRDIWFFVNSNRARSVCTEVRFPTGRKMPWKWNPENGTKEPFSFTKSPDEFTIALEPLQSLLLVFEPEDKGSSHQPELSMETDTVMTITGPWIAEFNHIKGISFNRSFDILNDFGTSDDAELNSFAGTVHYETFFESDGTGKYLILDKVNKGVTGVYVNGRYAGTCWYGKPHFRIDSLIHKGENTLEIRYTSVLSNYVRTLRNNPTALRWTSGYDKIPLGPEGPVTILGSKSGTINDKR